MSKIFTITEGLENMGALRTGGQGSVYKGKRTGTIITAVKLLPTPIHTESEEDKNFRNFQNEVEKLKKVNEEPNPNVVKILNSGITESGSFPFIEMEFIDGPDLEDLLKPPHDAVFTIKEVIKVADQLANALAHCHKFSVKHGDIKSNNVKFNVHSGNYVLLDFGLSAMSDDQRRTSIRHAGAVEFMAPEQNEGQLLFQTDVYSYGIILYELLSGQVPFPLTDQGQKSRNDVMLAHMEQAIPDLNAIRHRNIPENWSDDKKLHEMQVPSWLLQVVEKCLQKDPLQRFGNGVELQDFIIHRSVASTTEQGDYTLSAAVMTSENERLQALVLQYQEAAQTDGTVQAEDADHIKISRPVFYAMVTLMVVLAVAMGLLLFANSGKNNPEPRSKNGSPVTDSPATTPQTDTGPVNNIPDSVLDTASRIKPAEVKPITKPAHDTTKLDLDTAVHF